jgi:hypothetical protein
MLDPDPNFPEPELDPTPECIPVFIMYGTVHYKGVTKRCRLSWLIIAPSCLSPNAKGEGGGGDCGVSANEYSCASGAK